jgi:hypothetical protein
MVRKLTIIVLFLLLVPVLPVAGQIQLILDDYNDQDGFNHFSGNWNTWQTSPGALSWSFDTINRRDGSGACLRVDYSVPSGGSGGVWNSLIGKEDYKNQTLDFTDLYGDLKNSTGNPTDIENVQATQFSFWAKGNGIGGNYNHVVKVEFKDRNGNIASRVFTIPNMGTWTKYEFPVDQMDMVDLTAMKTVVLVVSDFQNDYRTSHFFIDDLSLTTTEIAYDAGTWDEDAFLDLVSHRLFKYFMTFTDDLGFAQDRSTFSDLVSVGAIGFQLAAYCIGHQRNWAENLEGRVEFILQNLVSLSMGPDPGTAHAGYKGFFYHFLQADTGRRKNANVELSLYDTMLLMVGVLTAKQYFSSNANIQSMAQSLYDAVQWSWMVDTSTPDHLDQFHLAWKPESGFEDWVDGYTDEALLVDVLAFGSTTYPTTMETYNARSRDFGEYPPASTDPIAAAWTGSLFNYFFASGWLDIKHRGRDRHATHPLNIWENNLRAIVANRQFSIDHQDTISGDGDNQYTTYSDVSWGLTACDNLADPVAGPPSEYLAFGALPTQQNIQFPQTVAPHVGTIAVYGAGSSITYLPTEAIAALEHYYTLTGLWSPFFGFGDAYSLDPHFFEADPATGWPILDADDNLIIHPATWLEGAPWLNHMMMGIDQGPMLLTIENYRSGLIWDLARQNVNIQAGLNAIFQPPTCLGDSDHDWAVDGVDLAWLIESISSGNLRADLNEDFAVNALDAAVFAGNYGRIDCP